MASIFDFFRRKKEVNSEFASSKIQPSDIPDFGSGRTSTPRFAQSGSVPNILTKRLQRDLFLDETTLQTATLDKIIDILSDAHPDVGFAIWNFLRIGNCDYRIKVYKVGSDKEDTASQKLIQQFIQTLDLPNINNFETSRSLKKVLNKLMLSVITRGAASMELVLGSGLTNVAFFAPVDPVTISFRFENDRYVPYQMNNTLSLDIPTFIYEGLDERIDDPYGRSPIMNSIQMVMFQLQVLHDIKAVVHNQGYPRFDITILEEVLLQRMPISIRNNEEKKSKWLKDKLNEVINMYNGLQPDDTFVHYDSIKMDTVGGKGGGALIDPEKLMTVIDNQIMAGLKTLSTILGRRSTGNTESFAKLEVKLYMAGVRAIQEVVERIMSRALTLMLNLNGKQGVAEFKFEPIEIRTELEQEQFNQIRLQNIAFKRDQGWIDQDMASIEAVGTPAIGEPDQTMLGVSGTNKDGQKPKANPDTNPNNSTSN